MSNSEKASLEQIVSAHLTELLRFATRLTGNPDAAEEVVHGGKGRNLGHWLDSGRAKKSKREHSRVYQRGVGQADFPPWKPCKLPATRSLTFRYPGLGRGTRQFTLQ